MPSTIVRSQLVDAIAELAPVIAADMETGEILLTSPTIERMFGYSVRNELVGACVDVLVPEAIRSQLTTNRLNYAKDVSIKPMTSQPDLRGQRKDGTTFPIEIGLWGIVLNGRKCVIIVVLELSEREPD